ncbi:MAG: BrxA/BrxB family bacilliredoxin [Bacteroidota bacterium]|nr:BrxA/BrxB family bacilliredoxin [Candidatus Kapabacteria bacterium]MCS7301982.1 BrxA/BrxB family bacilliredoxin [Candidatus Kapabacteria bacterium]MCX7936562.1 BrxA/BrxB family bacilliredoxin [Chlorobiota bacterium]MDW8074755.1 BrxA/BrxB family bacilliredoxin [Bacteroidota bacterium]MDW8271394.1 BrxA/BrxB family bacilliredoxin [Bacteroidota bacterium]
MRYDPLFVAPMREELVRLGFEELHTPEDVDRALERPGTTLLVINSVCGCAAGSARPAVALSLRHTIKPDYLVTVFAGMDIEATQHVRERYLIGQPPSSPSIALFVNGKLATMIHRYQIEGHYPETIAQMLVEAYDRYCQKNDTTILA